MSRGGRRVCAVPQLHGAGLDFALVSEPGLEGAKIARSGSSSMSALVPLSGSEQTRYAEMRISRVECSDIVFLPHISLSRDRPREDPKLEGLYACARQIDHATRTAVVIAEGAPSVRERLSHS